MNETSYCQQCGAELSPRDQFCMSCGASVDGEPVPVAAPESVHRPRRRPIAFAAAALGVVVLIAVAIAAAGGLGGGPNGASSPEALAEELAAAATSEDLLAIANLVDPREARDLPEIAERLTETANAAYVGGRNGKGGRDGLSVDVAVEGLDVEVEELADGVAKVSATGGRVAASATGLPEGMDSSTEGNLADPAFTDYDGASRQAFFIARERGGRWFLSPAMTIAEYVVADNDLPPSDFNAVADEEADDVDDAPEDPEQLGRRFAKVLNDRDFEAVAGLIAEGQRGPLRAYLPALRAAVSGSDGSSSAELSSFRVEEEAIGDDRVRLDVRSLTGSASSYDGYAEFSVDGPCAQAVGQGSSCFGESLDFFYGAERFFVVAEKRAGRYRLDPLGTLSEYLKRRIDRMSVGEIASMVGKPEQVDPTATLTVGKKLTADLDTNAVVATFDVDADKGVLAFLSTAELAMFDDRGRQLRSLSTGGFGRTVIDVPAQGRYRLVAYPVDPSRDESRSMTIESEALSATDFDDGSRVSGRLGPTGTVVLTRELTGGEVEGQTITLDGEEGVSVTASTVYSYEPETVADDDFYLDDLGLYSLISFGRFHEDGEIVDRRSGDEVFDTSGAYGESTIYTEGDPVTNLVVLEGEPGRDLSGTISVEIEDY